VLQLLACSIQASRQSALHSGGWKTGGGDFNDQSQPPAKPGRRRSKQRTNPFHINQSWRNKEGAIGKGYLARSAAAVEGIAEIATAAPSGSTTTAGLLPCARQPQPIILGLNE
jgi:hypothetical protein